MLSSTEKYTHSFSIYKGFTRKQKEEPYLLRHIVSKVLVDKIGGVQLKLINGQIL